MLLQQVTALGFYGFASGFNREFLQEKHVLEPYLISIKIALSLVFDPVKH